MASFTKKIQNIYIVDTYQGTKNTYDWICKAIHKGDFPELIIETQFLFKISDIVCSCKGIEEFVENAFGRADYDLISMNISVYSADKSVAFIIIDSFRAIKISADSKVMLERVVNLVENTTLDETEINDPISVTYIENHINNDSVIIQGNGNIVANNHSKAEVGKEKKESEFRTFWKGVFQNIASNLIGYLLSLAVGGMLIYLLTK